MAQYFAPETLQLPEPHTPAAILRFNPGMRIMHPQFLLRESNHPHVRHTDFQTLVVFVSHYSDYHPAHPSVAGVYFGPNSDHNSCTFIPIEPGISPETEIHRYRYYTDLCAIHYALCLALDIANKLGKDRVRYAIMKVVVATDAIGVLPELVNVRGNRRDRSAEVNMVNEMTKRMWVQDGIMVEYWPLANGCPEICAARDMAGEMGKGNY